MPNALFGALVLFFSPALAFAGEIMFEGYYRVELAGKSIGYAIQRYEFEPKTKTFEATSFMRVKIGEEISQESLKAKADDKFNPISYNYTFTGGKEGKAIDATFKGEIMDLKITDGKKLRTEKHKIPKGTFLSTFLMYVMLQRQLKLNQAFKYSAVAEEEGASYTGKAWLQSKEARGKYVVFRVLNAFKGEEFISNLAAVPDPDPKKVDTFIKGEMIGSTSPTKNLNTQLMPVAAQATEGHIIPNKSLLTLFGTIPTGKVNLIATGAEPQPKEN